MRAVYQTEGCLQIGLVNRDKVQLECRKLSPFRCYLLSVNIESKIIKVKLGSMRPLPSAQREERGWVRDGMVVGHSGCEYLGSGL